MGPTTGQTRDIRCGEWGSEPRTLEKFGRAENSTEDGELSLLWILFLLALWTKIQEDFWRDHFDLPTTGTYLLLGLTLFCFFFFLVSAGPQKQKGLNPTRKSVSVIFSWLLSRALLAAFLVICPSLRPLFPGVSITLFRGEEALSITMQCLRGSHSFSWAGVLRSFFLFFSSRETRQPSHSGEQNNSYYNDSDSRSYHLLPTYYCSGMKLSTLYYLNY